MDMKYEWKFPLSRTHTGMLLGNGTMGVMVWGEGSVLRLTIGRADFWDHRGAMGWRPEMKYRTIRDYLARGDEKGVNELLTPPPAVPGQPKKPTILPIGRFELDFGKGVEILAGVLHLAEGTITLNVRKSGKVHTVRLTLAMDRQVFCCALPRPLDKPAVRRIPAWEFVENELKSISVVPPRPFVSGKVSGWTQDRPADPSLCVAFRTGPGILCIAAEYGEHAKQARAAVEDRLEETCRRRWESIAKSTRAWWRNYWKEVPVLRIPNPNLEFLYRYGMYKLAGFTRPEGVPGTLQGPWIEEYQMPPWSSDYHFNINVQMCYWPAYHGNQLQHLLPLFEMVWSWRETLARNAKLFVGIDDGFMLPHSVDDRGGCIGGYWAGSVDHGSTGWVALMMYRYYRFTMDRVFLRDRAYPFMFGAMRVYEEMLEWKDGVPALPVSVSPEYHDMKGKDWGRNASFQLACVHALCEALTESARVLGEQPRPVWREILEELPKASLVGGSRIDPASEPMIAVWEGVPLEESHRHHSHLAGITPFDVFDPADPQWRPILVRSLNHWLYHGMGLWSGWCVPWAAAIEVRFGNGDAAELLLEYWSRLFTNYGHGTLHDCDFPGVGLMGISAAGEQRRLPEIMQLDAGLGATGAIQEMLLHTRRGVSVLFAGAPQRWANVSFERMRTDGAFLVSARREGGTVTRVEVESPAGGPFRLANPWDGPAEVRRGNRKTQRVTGKVLEVPTEPGDHLEIFANGAGLSAKGRAGWKPS